MEYLDILKRDIKTLRVDRNNLDSTILTNENLNIFESLVLPESKTIADIRRLYRFTDAIAEHPDEPYYILLNARLEGFNKLIVLIKTDIGKTFGLYIPVRLFNDDSIRFNHNIYLFSIDLNEKFRLSDNVAIYDMSDTGIEFMDNNNAFGLFHPSNECIYVNRTNNVFNLNGIDPTDIFGPESYKNIYKFTPIEVEVYQLTE